MTDLAAGKPPAEVIGPEPAVAVSAACQTPRQTRRSQPKHAGSDAGLRQRRRRMPKRIEQRTSKRSRSRKMMANLESLKRFCVRLLPTGGRFGHCDPWSDVGLLVMLVFVLSCRLRASATERGAAGRTAGSWGGGAS